MKLPRGWSLVKLLTDFAPELSYQECYQSAPEKLQPYLASEYEHLRACSVNENFAENGNVFIAGADEVGRGPMAGPLAAGAVCFNSVPWIPGLRDSKQLSEAEREAMVPWIKAKASAWATALVDVDTLNAGGSINAHSLAAMRQALSQLPVTLNGVLIDGKYPIPNLEWPQRAVIKGDDLCVTISAASVLAKVRRDRIMNEYDRDWPAYGFAEHKGYCTAKHMQAVQQFGILPIHRRRYRPIAQLIAEQSEFTLE